MIRDDEYAFFATQTYVASPANTLIVPEGWEVLAQLPDDSYEFSASAYRNIATGEVVIAYTGTNDHLLVVSDWTTANIPAAFGWPAPQVRRAIEFYSNIAAMPTVDPHKISFTGHSLGGGLASSMAVFFEQPAVTFATAPFEASALDSALIVDYFLEYQRYQNSRSRPVSAAFGAFADTAASGGFGDNFEALFAAREALVRDFYIEGEILSLSRLVMDAIYAQSTPIDLNLTELTTPAERALLHSMSLHAVAMVSAEFRERLSDTPYLIDLLLDGSLYSRASAGSEVDFTVLLLQGQYSRASPNDGAGPIDQFAAELGRLGTGSSATARASPAQ